MKVSEFMSGDIPVFLLGAFYGRFEFTANGEYVYTYSDYRNGAIYNNPILCRHSKDEYIIQLNNVCAPYSFWERRNANVPKKVAVFVLENDLRLTGSDFFDRLDAKIRSLGFINDVNLTEEKKSFIRGFAELRASVDRKRSYFAMDYVYDSQKECERGSLFIENLNIPDYVVNYNFRETQPQYIAGKKRATQFRFNIDWYARTIGFINEYKTAVYENNFIFSNKKQINGITYFD